MGEYMYHSFKILYKSKKQHCIYSCDIIQLLFLNAVYLCQTSYHFLVRHQFSSLYIFLLKANKRKIDIVYPGDAVEWVDGNNMFRIFSYSNFANNMQRRLCLTETKKAYYLKWTQFSIGLS
jgi:hypothetical protein